MRRRRQIIIWRTAKRTEATDTISRLHRLLVFVLFRLSVVFHCVRYDTFESNSPLTLIRSSTKNRTRHGRCCHLRACTIIIIIIVDDNWCSARQPWPRSLKQLLLLYRLAFDRFHRNQVLTRPLGRAPAFPPSPFSVFSVFGFSTILVSRARFSRKPTNEHRTVRCQWKQIWCDGRWKWEQLKLKRT